MMHPKAIEKFYQSIDKTNFCWNWIGFLDKSGLPIIRIMDDTFKESSPRRLSLNLSGKFPDSSERAQPLICRNKLCVNPDHLVFGDEARFWAKVQKLSEANGGCWVWIASQDKNMYGKFKIFKNGNKIDVRAHQYSWELFTGRPVPDNLVICHKCDHPYCVNPNHLFIGTVADNNEDRLLKGRTKSKLNKDQVIEIRLSYQNKIYTINDLVNIYNVHPSTIKSIINRDTWKHIM